MRLRELHVVIGGGIAGCLSALFRRRAGFDVMLLESQTAAAPGARAVCTQTSNIVSENHSGAEYPFDERSATDCLDGRIENEKFFPELIYGGKAYSRILASRRMIEEGGIDILGICRRNLDVLRKHYEWRCNEGAHNRVFGDPSSICREIPPMPDVHDVAGTFVTPQRGLNPVYVAAILDAELARAQVDFRGGQRVEAIDRLRDGRFLLTVRNATEGRLEEVLADQLSLCSAAHSFRMARRLNTDLALPRIFMALREILYVSLPDGTDKNFTCLKLEGEFGGMMSVLNQQCAMVYYPPAAHIQNMVLDPASCNFPEDYARALDHGHHEQSSRAEWTLSALRRFYPDLQRSEILGVYLKVAINTVRDSRVRRNLGVYRVLPSCTLTVLPKWTMCVANAKKELDLVLEHSTDRGNMDRDEAAALRDDANRYRITPPEEWTRSPDLLLAAAGQHAFNMNVPRALAIPMQAAVHS